MSDRMNGRAGIRELVEHISEAVNRDDVRLVATRAKQPTYRGGGG